MKIVKKSIIRRSWESFCDWWADLWAYECPHCGGRIFWNRSEKQGQFNQDLEIYKCERCDTEFT